MRCRTCLQEGHTKRSCRVDLLADELANLLKIGECDTYLDKSERIVILKQHINSFYVNHEENILSIYSLKGAHVYCVLHNLSAQQYGPLLEKYIRIRFGYIKNKPEHCIGDCSKDGKNSEIKVSLGGKKHNKFNFVQLRPAHDCAFYIFTAYNLSNDNVESEGELYIFKISDIKKLIVSYGGYAHGTIKENNRITIESVNEKNMKEYAIRPKINDDCWKELMRYRVDESSL
jgi:hypothetical protein